LRASIAASAFHHAPKMPFQHFADRAYLPTLSTSTFPSHHAHHVYRAAQKADGGYWRVGGITGFDALHAACMAHMPFLAQALADFGRAGPTHQFRHMSRYRRSAVTARDEDAFCRRPHFSPLCRRRQHVTAVARLTPIDYCRLAYERH
jgi:hypothetical protein